MSQALCLKSTQGWLYVQVAFGSAPSQQYLVALWGEDGHAGEKILDEWNKVDLASAGVSVTTDQRLGANIRPW